MKNKTRASTLQQGWQTILSYYSTRTGRKLRMQETNPFLAVILRLTLLWICESNGIQSGRTVIQRYNASTD